MFAQRTDTLSPDNLPGSTLGVAICCSVSFHVLVFMGIYFSGVFVPPELPLEAEESYTLSIQFAEKNPQREALEAELIDEVREQTDLLEELVAIEVAEQIDVMDSVETEDNQQEPPAQEDFRQATVVEQEELFELNSADLNFANNPGDEVEVADVLTPGVIARSVSSYTAERTSVLTRGFVADCIRYKNQHGVQDCPQNQTLLNMPHRDEQEVITRAYNDANYAAVNRQIARKFVKEVPLLEELTNAGGLTGELAKTQLQINLDNIAYLGGSFSGEMFANNTIDLRICWRDGKRKACIFRYTGFEIVPKTEEVNENEFAVDTPLFMPRP